MAQQPVIHKKVALVIGVGHYDLPGTSLQAPPYDASLCDSLLHGHLAPFYKVILCKDAIDTPPDADYSCTRADIRAALKEFLEYLHQHPSCLAFVFYSGHGAWHDFENYLLSSDFPGGSVRDGGISLEKEVLNPIRQKAALGVVVMDACRSPAPKSKGVDSSHPWAAALFSDLLAAELAANGHVGAENLNAEVRAKAGAPIAQLWACALSTEACDGQDGHTYSAYTSRLLTHLFTPGTAVLNATELASRDVADCLNHNPEMFVLGGFPHNYALVPSPPVLGPGEETPTLAPPAPLAPAAAPNRYVPGSDTYICQHGETLRIVGLKIGSTEDVLLQLNPELRDATMLTSGQVIKVPAVSAHTHERHVYSGRLKEDQTLWSLKEDGIRSDNGRYELRQQSDSNLVLHDLERGEQVWQSGTRYMCVAKTIMQTDGNLVCYNAQGGAMWASGTNGHWGARLAVENEGQCVIYSADGVRLWSTAGADRARFIPPLNAEVLIELEKSRKEAGACQQAASKDLKEDHSARNMEAEQAGRLHLDGITELIKNYRLHHYSVSEVVQKVQNLNATAVDKFQNFAELKVLNGHKYGYACDIHYDCAEMFQELLIKLQPLARSN